MNQEEFETLTEKVEQIQETDGYGTSQSTTYCFNNQHFMGYFQSIWELYSHIFDEQYVHRYSISEYPCDCSRL